MNDIEARTRKLATEAGTPQGRHEVDGRDLVSLDAGWLANMCAVAADAGGSHASMMAEVMRVLEGKGVAAQQPDSPGDAIRAAFHWTGWCHSRPHGSGTVLWVRLRGSGVPERTRKEALESAFAHVLVRELVTSEAADEAYKAAQLGSESYWAQRWNAAWTIAMGEVFPGGLPPQTVLRMRFGYSPW